MNQICYVEYSVTHPGDFIVDVTESHDWWLLILTHTPAMFLIDDRMQEYPPGCLVLYPPKSRIFYQGCSEYYKNDWIRFYSNEAYTINSGIPGGRPVIPSNPEFCHKLFQLLAEENANNHIHRDESIEALFRLLFNKLTEAHHYDSVHSQYQELTRLRSDIRNNPGFHWSVPFMASRLHLSTGHFQALYRKTFNIPCMEDVINNRILLAKEHIVQNNFTMSEIAGLCGYNNVEHFCRQFRQLTGYSPTNYRKRHLPKENV